MEGGLRLQIYLSEEDRVDGRPAAEAILLRAREAGLAGATLWRAAEGFSRGHPLHAAKVLRLSYNLPMVVEIVDRPERIRGFWEAIRGWVADGMATLEPVEFERLEGGGAGGGVRAD